MATNTHREHSLDATAEACLHNDGETLTVLLDHADNRACACMPRERAGGSITLGKALRLACLTRVHQSHAGATCLAGAHAYPPPGRLAGRGGALKNCSVASAIQLQ
jgi:hypothetical protein